MKHQPHKLGKNEDPSLVGARGMRNGLVYRQVNGVTVVSRAPKKPTSESAKQKVNRNYFREAAAWAKRELLDPARKLHFKKRAKRLGLPNSYTAAVKHFMRSTMLALRETAGKLDQTNKLTNTLNVAAIPPLLITSCAPQVFHRMSFGWRDEPE